MKDEREADYVLGHSELELARLERQAEIFAEPTEEVLRRAGLAGGMRVLDLGCGAGDVSLIAGRLVGPGGAVVGVDRSLEALATARRRAALAGLDWLSFRQADLDTAAGDERFDAIIGRFILLHVADPGAALRRLVAPFPGGTIVAFIEMDIGSAAAVPPMPLFSQCLDWITGVYRGAGLEPDMGTKLYGVFRAAGLVPQMTGTCRVEAGEDAVAYNYLADSLRSLLPWAEALGVTTAAEVGIDTLAWRVRAQALAGGHCFIFPRLIGAWARIGAEARQ